MVPHDPSEPPLVLSAYLGCLESYNEDLAIAYFMTAVHKDDFAPMSEALKDFFSQTFGVHLAEVLPCAIGDAYVHFHSPVERERGFLVSRMILGPITSCSLANMMKEKTLAFRI